ncbi:MAG TPA: DUF4249 domain-containing protein [Prolixibacteraceae bacterium]|nr:DUF4249 domain-containing protein [Prolixibacteraceae bacterium]
MKTKLISIAQNKITRLLTLAIIASFIFHACMKEVDFDEGVLESKLVVNGFVCADSTIKVQLAISKPIPGVEKSTEWVDDAIIKLFIDGEFAEELQNYELTYDDDNGDNYYYRYETPTSEYRSTQTIAKTGKTYKIEVEHPDFDNISAETTIPEAVTIDSLQSEIKETTEYGYTEFRRFFHVKFTDPGSINNYYRLSYSETSGRPDDYYWNPETEDYEINDSITIVNVYSDNNSYISTDDPLLVGEDDADDFLFMDAGNDYNLFTDDLINGQTYELSFYSYNYNRHSEELEKGEFYKNTVQLISLSKEAFLYIKSSYEHWWYDEEFLTEPVQVYTNINNGLGIFAGYSIDEFSFMEGEYPVDSVEYIYH